MESIPIGALHGREYLSPAAIAEMGRVSGEVSAALADLPAMPADRVLQWDLRQGPRVVELLADHIADAELRERMAGRRGRPSMMRGCAGNTSTRSGRRWRSTPSTTQCSP